MPPGLVAINRRYTKGFRLSKSWSAARDELVLLFAQDWICGEGLDGPISGDVSVTIHETWPQDKGDIDSPLKAVLDALQHAEVLVNDKQVKELHVYVLDPGDATLKVRVEELS